MKPTGVRFEVLRKENYDTWKIQMRAVLIKNDAWEYVSGTIKKPEPTADRANAAAIDAWIEGDSKAQADIILAIDPSEIKQVKGCRTARMMWTRLEEIYQSKGPARKAALLNSLMSMKMQDDDDAREHNRQFFDTVDKLADMEIDINPDLLSVILLRSLPDSFDNFRCAIASRDELPTPEILRIKIKEESDARKDNSQRAVQNAMVIGKSAKNNRKKGGQKRDEAIKKDARMKCFNCGTIGHRAKNCKQPKKPAQQSANGAKNVCLYISPDTLTGEVFHAKSDAARSDWCIDSGCTSHMCKDIDAFTKIDRVENGRLNLASTVCTEIKGKGNVSTAVEVNDTQRVIDLQNTLYVPDL